MRFTEIDDWEMTDQEVLFFISGYVNGLQEAEISSIIFEKLKLIFNQMKGGDRK